MQVDGKIIFFQGILLIVAIFCADQKIYNMVTVRKRRDGQNDGKVPEELDQKLRSMNIETSSAVGSLQPDQLDKLLQVLKDKKRVQVSSRFFLN